MKDLLLIFGLTILCFNISYSQNSYKYDIEINKELWKTDPIIPNENFDKQFLNDGNLHIHFQSTFDNDSAEIKVNGQFYGKYILTTESSTELADVKVIPDFETINTISISINNGKEAIIEIEKINQIIVRLSKERLAIGFSKHVPYYD